MQDDILLEQLQNNPDTAMSLLIEQYGGLVYAKEYNTAVQFFNQYDLPTEGLSRGEIKAYLSGHSVPKLPDEKADAGGRYDIAHVLNYLDDHNLLRGITSEELTPLVRAQYTALLLICEPDAGTPQEFYSVKGSLGDALAIDDTGNLLWKTASITNTFYSPITSSYTIGGTCTIFEYSFDKNGSLCSQKKTGLTLPYRR